MHPMLSDLLAETKTLWLERKTVGWCGRMRKKEFGQVMGQLKIEGQVEMGESGVITKHPRNIGEIVVRSVKSCDGRRERRNCGEMVMRSIQSGDGKRERRDGGETIVLDDEMSYSNT